MNIISWNVNGLRATVKKGALDWLISASPDVLCIQETKVGEDQLSENIRKPEGYVSHFFSSKIKKGYSGVAVYFNEKSKPEKTEYGIGIKKFDEQGRTLTLFYKNFVLVNVYVPNGGSPTADLNYKLEFYDKFLKYIEKLQKKHKNVIFCGDLNVAHEEIDIARPKENKTHIGFLPEERAWIDEVIEHGYIDSFRHFHSEKIGAYTYWDAKTMARDRNVGWRLDYFFVNNEFLKRVKKSEILNDVYGSDHCPILLEIKF